MSRTIQMTRRAERDLREIFVWISSRSPAGALQWLEAFEQSLKSASKSDTPGSFAPEADEFGINLSQLLFHTRRGRTFRILIMVQANILHVLSIRGSGQDLLTIEELELPE